MRSRSDEADGKSDAGSSRSKEEETIQHSNSQRSGKSEVGSDSSSSRNNNPIVEYTDSERAELLRRLDSIKDHLLRGGAGATSNSNSSDNKPKESDQNQNQPFLKPVHLHSPNLGPGPGGAGHAPSSYYHPYPDPYAAPVPVPVHGMFHHQPPQAYQDPYGYQFHRRPPPIPYHNPIPRYVEIGPDIVEPHSFFPATPSRYNDMPPYSPVSSSHHHSPEQQHSHFPASTVSRYNDMPPYSPVSSSHHPYNNSSSFPSSMSSPGPSRGGYARWPSDLDSEMGNGAFARGYVKKAVLLSDNEPRRYCHPLAGGAPFIACHSCFELLQLPKKKLLAQEDDKRLYKLQCASCSQVIRFKIVDKKLVLQETKPVSLEAAEDRNTTTNTVVVVTQEPESVRSESRCSDDDEEERWNISSEEQGKKDANHRVRSESQCCNDEERLSISSEQQQQGKKHVKSVRRRGSEIPEQPVDSASLLELFEYSNVNRAALAYGMVQLGYNKPEKQEPFAKSESVAAATETEVSSYSNGYSNTEISQDSRYSNGKEENKSGSTTEIITTRSSIDRNEGEDDEDDLKKLEVWVNGHLIPESLVSSAEKLAGPIQAGKYWYDYRAGFWGVMGKPCLGIIPTFIEEFSHPMPENCAMGNTKVFVNGRELHKRDFELLVGRGLPQDKNRSYIVDISGRILDGDSGEELKSLGKLAPTIEKVKHGFGMRVPRSLAS